MHYFIHGPSGSGKSYLSEELARSKNALLIETDLWPPCDGMRALGLKPYWDSFLGQCDSLPIETELNRRADQEHKTGCVISLPGFRLLTTAHAARAEGKATIVYLRGTPGQCLDAFLMRERESGRGLGIEHWAQNERGFFQALEHPDIRPLTVPAFDGYGGHRAPRDIVADIDRMTWLGRTMHQHAKDNVEGHDIN